MFQKQENISQAVVGYVNTDYAGNLDTRKSVTGFVSTVESYIAVSGCTLNNKGKLDSRHRGDKRVGLVEGTDNWTWDRQESVTVHCDSQSAIYLSKHQVFHERSKHIDVKLHFVRDITAKKEVKMEKISTVDNSADAMTKVLPQAKFK